MAIRGIALPAGILQLHKGGPAGDSQLLTKPKRGPSAHVYGSTQVVTNEGGR